MSGNGTPGKFNRHDRGGSFQERDHQDSQDMEVGVFIVGDLRHIGGDRAHQSVAEQNAQKGSHQCGSDLVPNLFRRSSPSAPIVITTPSTAATMPSPGKESAMVLRDAIGILA